MAEKDYFYISQPPSQPDFCWCNGPLDREEQHHEFCVDHKSYVAEVGLWPIYRLNKKDWTYIENG